MDTTPTTGRTAEATAPDAPASRPPAAVPEWERRLLPRRDTPARTIVDLAFGAAIPVALLHLDLRWLPSVLISDEGLIPFRPYYPMVALTAVVLYVGRYPYRNREGWAHALLAGPLLAAAIFAMATAVALLPLAAMGTLMAGIGLLGLLPFGTAAVFWIAARQSWRSARPSLARGPSLALALCAAALFGAFCLGAGRAAHIVEIRCTEILLGRRTGDTGTAELALRVLHACPGIDVVLLRRGAMRQWEDSLGQGAPEESPPAGAAWERITGRRFRAYMD